MYLKEMPRLDIRQESLLNSFYEARRQVSDDIRLPDSVMKQYPNHCDADVSVFILRKLDDHWHGLRAKKMQQASADMKRRFEHDRKVH